MYLDQLNDDQKKAVLHTGKPLLILAGAGSGKTRVITTKIAWLIKEQGMDPRSILAVTFTNKAAREMAERAKMIEPRAGDAMLRTFHSFGAWFLRRYANLHQYGTLNSDFIIYDDNDVISLLSVLMENVPKADVKQCAYSISRAKDYFLSPEDPLLAKIDSSRKFRDYYKRYEERMTQIGNVDFGDLIKKPVEILRGQPEVAKRFHERFKVIMVDEYQDANVAQFHLLKELCGEDTYVCVVGDDDQSIYRFRGAEVKNILEFPQKFANADIIRLEKNYRSTDPILKAANSVVDYNNGRLGKMLYAEKGDGSLPILAYLQDQDHEAAYCAEKIKNSVSKGETAWSDWAVLYRTNAQSLNFETLFLRRGIPYRVVGSLKFYEREEVKDALALLSLLVNPRDEVAFRRMANKPPRGAGKITIDKITDAAINSGGNLLEASRNVQLSTKAGAGIKNFIKVLEDAKNLFEKGSHGGTENTEGTEKDKGKDTGVNKKKSRKRDRIISGEGLSVCVAQIITDSGIADYHKAEDEITGNNRLSNLQELVNAASVYELSREGLLKFLEDIELDRAIEDRTKDDNNLVTLITFHNTKGLEFKRVFMTGLDHGIFPREDKKGDELEEERRLFYVGATRAMDELYLTTCRERRMYGTTKPMQPSLFLREIDRDFLQTENDIPKQQSGFSNHRYINRTMPDTFNPFELNAESNKISEAEEVSGYRRGQRIFHENYGYGAVVKVSGSDDGPLVRVRFDNGKETQFLSEYQSRAFEKIAEDY